MSTYKTSEPRLEDDLFSERARFFMEFLEAESITGTESSYKASVESLLRNKQRRLIINLNTLRNYNPEYAQNLIEFPNDFVPPFQKALKDAVIACNDLINFMPKKKLEEQQFYVGFSGSFFHHLNPRTLKSIHLSKLISIEGIVSRCSFVRLKLAKSVHHCGKTGEFHQKEYRDFTTIGNFIPTSNAYPTEDGSGNQLTTEFGYSVYRDHQTICLQEMPEKAPAGQLLRSIDIVLDDDLVDKVKPGDRIQLAGIYRAIGKPSQNSTSATFRTVLIATNITILSGDMCNNIITADDSSKIEEIAKQRKDDIFEFLTKSLAPSIYGHEYIKKAILLLLLGGKEQNLTSGDPSTAKSQLLRRVLNIAPLCIATTGRGSSGVGLTAAVTRDKETGERSLDAGAMVLADRGVVCIDEFDKMTDVDRVAIHEVMEQQTVTIAKAGIHTSLNARCSVIAAANPYDVHKTPAQNIALPDSILSRFDLVFVITDDIDNTRDRIISQHVLHLHRYRPPNLEEGTPIKDSQQQTIFMKHDDTNNGTEEPTPVYIQTNYQSIQQQDPNEDGVDGGGSSSRSLSLRAKENEQQILTSEFFKKYIQYAKSLPQPTVSKKAAEYIVNVWVELRNANMAERQTRTAPITPRALDSLFRLATAHAKARLREKVTVKDAKVAEEIVRFALFKEVINKKVKRRTRRNNHKRHKGKGRMEVDSPPKGDENTNQSTLSQNQYETFRELFSKITSKFLSKIKYDELLEEINKLSAENNIEHFDVEEMKSALEAMEKDGKALRTDDSVFLI
ncbi:16362_t:CDS:10 [Entrophospora sp. SA101]|nr:16362_t:CDS:10 [Entrophospora sp. SA101]